MMARYIDADKLRLSMADAFCLFDIPFHRKMAKIVFREIERAPMVKNVEVKRGEWNTKYPLRECSLCGEIYSELRGNDGKGWNYCPNCGAKMGG